LIRDESEQIQAELASFNEVREVYGNQGLLNGVLAGSVFSKPSRDMQHLKITQYQIDEDQGSDPKPRIKPSTTVRKRRLVAYSKKSKDQEAQKVKSSAHIESVLELN
jgi:hypothetical protein